MTTKYDCRTATSFRTIQDESNAAKPWEQHYDDFAQAPSTSTIQIRTTGSSPVSIGSLATLTSYESVTEDQVSDDIVIIPRTRRKVVTLMGAIEYVGRRKPNIATIDLGEE